MSQGFEQAVPAAMLIALNSVLGLVVGSFVNVLIERIPAGVSIIKPASHCMTCAHVVRYRHNVPVISWVLLGGKCHDCKTPITARYPLVELTTGVLFGAVTWRVISLDLTWALGAYLYLCAIGIALSIIDFDTKRLPDRIVLPSYLIVGALLLVASIGRNESWPLARAVVGAAAMFAFYFALVLARPGGMGFGDAKLAGLLGAVTAYISWTTLVVGAFAAFALGAIAGIAIVAAGRGGAKTLIPFGPFMIAAALLAIFVADPIADIASQTLAL